MANIYKGKRCDNNEEVVGVLFHIKGTPLYYIIPNCEVSRLIINESTGKEVNIHAHRVTSESLKILNLQEDIRKLDDSIKEVMSDITNGVTNKDYILKRLSAIEEGLWSIK